MLMFIIALIFCYYFKLCRFLNSFARSQPDDMLIPCTHCMSVENSLSYDYCIKEDTQLFMRIKCEYSPAR